MTTAPSVEAIFGSQPHAAHPPPPEPARFDPNLNAWILSRYADVLIALREPHLCQVGPRGKSSRILNRTPQSHKRAELRATLPHSRLAIWESQIDLLAQGLIGELPTNRPVDLVREFVRPWCLGASLIVNGADQPQSQRLADLAYYLPSGAADCHKSVLQLRAAAALSEVKRSIHKGLMPPRLSLSRLLSRVLRYALASGSFALHSRVANAKLKQLDRSGAMPLGKSVFLGTSQTVPLFAANAWLALFRHPGELARLQAQPSLMATAVEELLRYAGVVHTLFREATADVALDGVRVVQGQRVILKLASANRDPMQFPEPDRLDLGRRVLGQLGLGGGSHSCLGALLVRIAARIAIKAFVDNLASAEFIGPSDWFRNDTVRAPESLTVVLRHSVRRTV